MAPAIRNAGKGAEQVVIVLDHSASMQYQYDENMSRLDCAKKKAVRLVDGLNEDSRVTVLSCGTEAEMIYQGTDKATAKKRIRSVEVTNETGTLENADSLIHSLISDMDTVEIYAYTDTQFNVEDWNRKDSKAAVTVESVYQKGENCSLDYVNYTIEEDGVSALCKVSNDTERVVTQDISL